MTPAQAQSAQQARWRYGPHPSLLVGYNPDTDDYIRVRVNEDGELVGTGGGGGSGGDVVVTNDLDNPVNSHEIPYESFVVESYTVPYSATADGAVFAADVPCVNFLLIAPATNTTNIFIGNSDGTCFIPLTPGSHKTYSLPNADLIYAYALEDGKVAQLIVERYFL